jgi:hypothetical protein
MKVVKQISTGNIIHREIPDFETGKGIINASFITGISQSDLEEVEITQTEWDNHQATIQATIQEKANQKQSAIDKLKALGLTDDEISALIGE